MNLLRLQNISLEFGEQIILSDANFSVEADERICLIGRNGVGKSTLLKIITGAQDVDRGEMHIRQHLRVSTLPQDLPEGTEQRVFDAVKEGLSVQVGHITRYEQLAEHASTAAQLNELEALQSDIDAAGGWNIDQQVEATLSQLQLPADAQVRHLSGGWRRRVALAQALVSQPDLLLLDEPTNHLDISTIEWLEHAVRGFRGSVIFITHDRSFLQRLATRIVEVDRGRLISWPGSYHNYLTLKEKADEEEDRRNALFDKRLAQEEVWIRQGIKARRTRNEGRVRALKAMRDEHSARLKRQGKANIQTTTITEQSGRKVIDARGISHSFGKQPLINKLDLKIMRGDRIGLIGNNGVGKSTLLAILLGKLEPEHGSVKLGTNLDVAYFDQVREELDLNKNIAEFVGEGRDFIDVDGKQRHIISYLQQFLFSPKRSQTKIRALSGGERSRVMLAKLFTRPSNLLILDEPSNDLDIEMLEALEQRLVSYQGTLIVVSHDRELLDNVVTSTLVFEENGHVQNYVGGYSDWQSTQHRLATATAERELQEDQDRLASGEPVPQAEDAKVQQPSAKSTSSKLSFTQAHELKELPKKIAGLEKTVQALQATTVGAAFYKETPEYVKETLGQLGAKQAELDAATERWFELEELIS